MDKAKFIKIFKGKKMIQEKDRKIKVELTDREIEDTIDRFENAPYSVYLNLGFDKIVNKLKKAIK